MNAETEDTHAADRAAIAARLNAMAQKIIVADVMPAEDVALAFLGAGVVIAQIVAGRERTRALLESIEAELDAVGGENPIARH